MKELHHRKFSLGSFHPIPYAQAIHSNSGVILGQNRLCYDVKIHVSDPLQYLKSLTISFFTAILEPNSAVCLYYLLTDLM
jgi:hypothetical protein